MGHLQWFYSTGIEIVHIVAEFNLNITIRTSRNKNMQRQMHFADPTR